MRDSVNIIKYWIKELRKIREFQELAKTEDLEFLRLYGETDRALKNLFIETADEYGVKRLEKIAGIYPEAEDTLEQGKPVFMCTGMTKSHTQRESLDSV